MNGGCGEKEEMKDVVGKEGESAPGSYLAERTSLSNALNDVEAVYNHRPNRKVRPSIMKRHEDRKKDYMPSR